MSGGRLGHRPALDGLRGIAIAAVLALHFFNVKGGFYGVDLFFVLSGFLITTLLLEERDRFGSVALRAFYIRRARRLLPALYALIAAAIALGSFRYPPTRLVEIAAVGALYVANIARALPSDPHVLGGSPLDHLWSLAEEEQFYLLWPALLLVGLRRLRERQIARWLIVLFACLIAVRVVWAATGAYVLTLYFTPVTHADGLLVGCAAAFWRRAGINVGTKTAGAAVAVTVAAIVVGPAFAWYLPLVVTAQAVVLLAALQSGWLGRVLSVRPLTYLGEISYSLYLWHEIVRWQVRADHPVWGIVFTMPLALGSYYLIERRFRHTSSTTPGWTGASAPSDVPVSVPA